MGFLKWLLSVFQPAEAEPRFQADPEAAIAALTETILLQPKGARPDWFSRLLNATLGWFFRLFNRGLSATNSGYIVLLRRIVRLSLVVLLIYVGLLWLTYRGFRTVPTGFIPSQDQGYLIVNLQMPDAATIERTRAVTNRLCEIAAKTPGVHDTIGIAGFSVLTGANSSAAGTIFLPLDSF